MKINRDLFCISLDLHYLCIRKHCHGLSLAYPLSFILSLSKGEIEGVARGKSGQHRAPHF